MIANFNGFCIDNVNLEDAKSIHQLMVTNAERFKRYFPKTLEDNATETLSKTFVKSKVDGFLSKTVFLFTIKEKNTNAIVGLIYIKELDWTIKQGEFAYCIDSKCGGKQLMSKAIKILSEYAFTDLGLETLQIIAHKDNIPSVKVALNNNFKWIKTLLNEFTPIGESPLDMELYELYN
jgi:ribosomal-protein-alanine N-acetyltransferase